MKWNKKKNESWGMSLIINRTRGTRLAILKVEGQVWPKKLEGLDWAILKFRDEFDPQG